MSSPDSGLLPQLPKTDPIIDVRAAPRFSFNRLHRIPFTVAATETRLWAYVTDLSIKGIGLLCCTSVPAEAQLTLSWEFGPPEFHRTLQAHVIYTSHVSEGLWALGCSFDTAFQEPELRRLLTSL